MAARLNIEEMLRLCVSAYNQPTHQLVVIGHEVRVEYEYIDFMDLDEAPYKPTSELTRHRIRKINGPWELLY